PPRGSSLPPGPPNILRSSEMSAGIRIAGVLLAAGTSSRMGKNKLFLELGGVSVLRRAARTALAAGLDPLLVVLGHESERARADLSDVSCTVVINPDYASGMNTSLRAGIKAVPDSASA